MSGVAGHEALPGDLAGVVDGGPARPAEGAQVGHRPAAVRL